MGTRRDTAGEASVAWEGGATRQARHRWRGKMRGRHARQSKRWWRVKAGGRSPQRRQPTGRVNCRPEAEGWREAPGCRTRGSGGRGLRGYQAGGMRSAASSRRLHARHHYYTAVNWTMIRPSAPRPHVRPIGQRRLFKKTRPASDILGPWMLTARLGSRLHGCQAARLVLQPRTHRRTGVSAWTRGGNCFYIRRACP